MIPLVGFLPADDPRMSRHGRGDRARPDATTASSTATRRDAGVDGLPPGEGAFLPCTFWLADNLRAAWAATTRPARSSSACSALRNDVGLLAEEYDPVRAGGCSATSRRPSRHVGLVNTARNLSEERGPAEQRHKE